MVSTPSPTFSMIHIYQKKSGVGITFWKELKIDFSTGIHFITPGENHLSNYTQNLHPAEILIVLSFSFQVFLFLHVNLAYF